METEQQLAETLAEHFQMVADNDRSMYDQRRKLVSAHLRAVEAGERENYPHLLGDDLKDWARTLAGLEADRVPVIAAEFASVAISAIDWRAVAIEYIAQEREMIRR